MALSWTSQFYDFSIIMLDFTTDHILQIFFDFFDEIFSFFNNNSVVILIAEILR